MIIYPRRKYPPCLFKIENGIFIELKYKWSSNDPYLGIYYTEYEDSNGIRVKVRFFADYEILTPNIVKPNKIKRGGLPVE